MTRLFRKNFRKSSFGQVTIEFTFCLLIVAILMYGLMKAFRWAGMDLSERRLAAETDLTFIIDEDWPGPSVNVSGPMRQFVLNYYKTKKIGMVFNKW